MLHLLVEQWTCFVSPEWMFTFWAFVMLAPSFAAYTLTSCFELLQLCTSIFVLALASVGLSANENTAAAKTNRSSKFACLVFRISIALVAHIEEGP